MPFEDDKPKDTENSMFEASSVLVAEANFKVLQFSPHKHIKSEVLYKKQILQFNDMAVIVSQ